MRITNSMTIANTLWNINKAENRLAKANEANSSQKKIQSASDDPVVAARSITYSSYVSQTSQYQDNNKAADSWQKTTDTALSSLNDEIKSLQDLTTEAASDTCSDDDRASIKTKVETLREQIITTMNTDHSGRYVFGGYSTSEEPYTSETTTIGNSVSFKGKSLSLGGVVSADISDEDIKAYYNSNSTNVYDPITDAASTAKTTSDTLATAASTYGAAAATTDLTTVAVDAKNTSDTLAVAVTKYGATTKLTDAQVAADNDYTTAQAAAAADPLNPAKATAASAAKNTSDILAAAVTNYGSNAATTALTDVATAARTTATTLAKAVTTYGGTTHVTDAATQAKNTSDTLAAAGATYGAATNLTDAATQAKNTSATLAAAVTTYGAATTLTDAATQAKDAYDTAKTAADAAPNDTTKAKAAANAKTTSDALEAAVTAYGTAAATTALTDVATAGKNTSDILATAVISTKQNINYTIGSNSKVTVNTEGQDVIGQGTSNLFNTIDKLLLALGGDTSYKTTGYDASGKVAVTTKSLAITDLIDEFKTDQSRLTVSQSTLGARMNKVGNATDTLQDTYDAYKDLQSGNQDVGTAEALTEQTSANNAYEAALSAGSKAIAKTLLDYM